MSSYFSTHSIGSSFVSSVMGVNKHPKQFFEEMDIDGSYKDSIMLLSLLMVFPAMEPVFFNDMDTMMIVFPGIVFMGLFVAWLWSQYVSRVLRIFLHINVDKKSVFRVVAYANSLNVLHLTVFLSPAVLIWQIYLMWRGFVSHLGINTEVAGWLVAIPFVFITFSGLGIVMFMGVTGIIHFD